MKGSGKVSGWWSGRGNEKIPLEDTSGMSQDRRRRGRGGETTAQGKGCRGLECAPRPSALDRLVLPTSLSLDFEQVVKSTPWLALPAQDTCL